MKTIGKILNRFCFYFRIFFYHFYFCYFDNYFSLLFSLKLIIKSLKWFSKIRNYRSRFHSYLCHILSGGRETGAGIFVFLLAVAGFGDADGYRASTSVWLMNGNSPWTTTAVYICIALGQLILLSSYQMCFCFSLVCVTLKLVLS